MQQPILINWMFCCRDRHGNLLEQIESIDIELPDGELVELEGMSLQFRWCGDQEQAQWLRQTGEAEAPYLLKLYGLGRYPCWSISEHVGNIHWDMVGMSIPITLRLLNALRSRAHWSIHCAPTHLFDLWDQREQRITEEDLSR